MFTWPKLPATLSSNQFKSERVGSDGFVVGSAAFSAGEEWYYLVHAEVGAQWNLVSGEPYVTDLGVVATNGASSSGDLTMGAEGMRFFQTTMPANAAAWRLWLNGLTNTVLVKKAGVPLTGNTDLSQSKQMLVVPSYLVGGQLYFVGVNGAPGTTINLDSRLQLFTDIPFTASTNVTVTGYGYTTFRVQVPSDQLGWQMSVVVSNGNPNLAVRRDFVPNENNNDAYSEVAGTVTDSITLVPPTLSDGTFLSRFTVPIPSRVSCSVALLSSPRLISTVPLSTPTLTGLVGVSSSCRTSASNWGLWAGTYLSPTSPLAHGSRYAAMLRRASGIIAIPMPAPLVATMF
ncbi:MAG: hypothetical protein QM813_21205 [Verrucomicrobiota bacterium]